MAKARTDKKFVLRFNMHGGEALHTALTEQAFTNGRSLNSELLLRLANSLGAESPAPIPATGGVPVCVGMLVEGPGGLYGIENFTWDEGEIKAECVHAIEGREFGLVKLALKDLKPVLI